MNRLNRGSSPDTQIAAWVAQEDAEGCALATLAMICGQTYAEVKAAVTSDTVESGRWHKPDQDWDVEGATFYTLDWYLARQGFFLQRRYASWGLPMEPFAPIHYASVEQPSKRSHFVVVLADGAVLDPLRDGRFALSDWPKVNQIVGLVKP